MLGIQVPVCTLHLAYKQSLVVSISLVIPPYTCDLQLTYMDYTINTKFNYAHSEGFDGFFTIDIIRLMSMALPAHRHKKAVSVLIALVRLGLCMHDA